MLTLASWRGISRPEMLIDVADYRHVPRGPGVLLIGYEANYSLDYAKGRLGLLYSRKQAGGSAQENLRQAYDSAVAACRLLENEPEFADKLAFDYNACEISINDRLLAPNTDATFATLKPDFERFPFTPCPIASLASSGISALSSLFARSWSRKALRVLRKRAAIP